LLTRQVEPSRMCTWAGWLQPTTNDFEFSVLSAHTVRGYWWTSGLISFSPHYWDLDIIHYNNHQTVKMAKCETCPKTFATQEACKQHMAKMGHRKPRKKCDQCNKLFQDRTAAEAHMTQVGHWSPKIPCQTCAVKFMTHQAAKEHMADKNHYKDYCKPCDTRFPNENELRMVRHYPRTSL
jgi:hypothetical protein